MRKPKDCGRDGMIQKFPCKMNWLRQHFFRVPCFRLDTKEEWLEPVSLTHSFHGLEIPGHFHVTPWSLVPMVSISWAIIKLVRFSSPGPAMAVKHFMMRLMGFVSRGPLTVILWSLSRQLWIIHRVELLHEMDWACLLSNIRIMFEWLEGRSAPSSPSSGPFSLTFIFLIQSHMCYSQLHAKTSSPLCVIWANLEESKSQRMRTCSMLGIWEGHEDFALKDMSSPHL